LFRLIVGEDGFPMGLHHNMLIPMLQTNCDDEQAKDWLPKALNGEFIGTYAQTEIGHGTNLKKLETTATYDPKTQEFVLHSPTITSSKWLPGNLGKSSNFIVIMAQLWTQGKCYGPHAFMVQIRHPQTHEPMSGVTVGDIGPKIGINTNDNGYLRFNNVRIPRKNMLMGHSKVLENGTYTKPIHPKIGYASMMFVRSMMISGMAYFLAQAATIAVRYSCVRRQGQISGKEEVKVMEYQTQQYRILPQLARAYCFQFAGHYSRDLYNQVMQDVKEGKTDLMADLHALNSGLKSVTSFQTAQGIEQCRMSCGGHGLLNIRL
jgi:acyl-CoA oxidase